MNTNDELTPEQLTEATHRGVTSAGDITRLAAERFAGTMAVKARRSERDLTRAAKAGAPAPCVAELQARATALTKRAELAHSDAQLSAARTKVTGLTGGLSAAYGRVVNTKGKAETDVPVSLVDADGTILAQGRSDAAGCFAVQATVQVELDVHLVVGGSRYQVARAGRPLPSRPILARNDGPAPQPNLASKPRKS